MDIRFKEDKSDPIVFIFSYPERAMICINPAAPWSDVMVIAPVYDRSKPVTMSIEEFMTKALGWEALISTIFLGQGGHVSHALDDACGTSSGFFNIFSYIFRHSSLRSMILGV